ncbi:MAG: sulfocyanin-like copper-binding protein [Gemmatimonadales bacterium]
MQLIQRDSLLVLTSLVLAGPASAQSAALPAWMTVDSASHTISLQLRVESGGPDSSATINGARAGRVQVVVPRNWSVRWTWINADSSAAHSLVLMAEREKLPLQGGQPALDNAWTRAVVTGLKTGQRDLTSFVADQAGWYWLLCGVPGHALSGEWIGLKVDRDATEPSVVEKM